MVNSKTINVKGKENPKPDVPNLLIVTFFSVLFALGLDFGLSKVLKKNIQFLVIGYSCFLSICIISSFFIQIVYKIGIGQFTISSWILHGLIQYTFHAVILRISNYNLYNVLVDVHSVDTNTKRIKNNASLIVNLFIVHFWIFFAIKSVCCYLFCVNKTNCETLYIPGHVYCTIVMGLDVITLVQTLIYYYIYKAIKHLKVSLEDKGDIEKDIKWVRQQFTAVARICDNISPTYGRLVSTHF